jgi:antitoxin (DNA-binding transcriptional repressor) of toxin-antitoxin stability system
VVVKESVTVAEVARRFAEYLNRVAHRRETFVLVRDERPIAELRPVRLGRRLGDLPELLAGVPRLDDEEAFARDLDAARDELGAVGPSDPCAS